MDELLIYEIVKLQLVIQCSLLRVSMEILTFISESIKWHQLFNETYFDTLVFLSIHAFKNEAPYGASLKNSYIYTWY